MKGSVIHELDDRPVVEIIDLLIWKSMLERTPSAHSFAIGVNYGRNFSLRRPVCQPLITGILPDASGVMIFEPDLEQGMEIQFMLRDSNKMIESRKTIQNG
jgi:small ligand-binding sensory domain FIST